jgi:hypothetical protein
MEWSSTVFNRIRFFSGPGVRRYPRFKISEISLIKAVHSKEDFKIKVVNISRGGALLRTNRYLTPGTQIQLNIVIVKDTVSFTGLVLRSQKNYSKWRLRHQVAVAFYDPLLVLDSYPETIPDLSQSYLYEFPRLPSPSIETVSPLTSPVEDDNSEMIDAFLATGICCEQDAAWQEMSGLNNW